MKTAAPDEIEELAPWFHNLHLPDGRQTAPNHELGDFPAFKWRQLANHIPENLRGWRALDVGCNAGFYSFELARRGADVTGIDLDSHYLAQARWAAKRMDLAGRVQFEQIQVYELARRPEQFDLVLFMGVFYHLRYPLLGLDILAQKVKRLLVFQTLTLPGREVAETANVGEENLRGLSERAPLTAPGWPKMAFIEHSFVGDPTNWWVANHAAVEAMLRSSGLRVIAYPGDEIYLCEPNRGHPSGITTWNKAEYLAATGQS
ncbi:MAG TPA: TIGR04290 family methyltransferase [Chthoniobacterales bacterium]|jgi:tRNA (mo5U34)-methyltransferase|nr:TIGR04290 family methyltransferase [Chthoniobacterales bacterium]